MDIQAKVTELSELYKKLSNERPELTDMTFTVSDIPVESLKAYAKERDLPISYNAARCAIRTTIYIDSDFLGSIHLISRKVKLTKPVVLQEGDYVEA